MLGTVAANWSIHFTWLTLAHYFHIGNGCNCHAFFIKSLQRLIQDQRKPRRYTAMFRFLGDFWTNGVATTSIKIIKHHKVSRNSRRIGTSKSFQFLFVPILFWKTRNSRFVFCFFIFATLVCFEDQHCRLHRMGNDFYVMALESQIGTLVDGQHLAIQQSRE